MYQSKTKTKNTDEIIRGTKLAINLYLLQVEQSIARARQMCEDIQNLIDNLKKISISYEGLPNKNRKKRG